MSWTVIMNIPPAELRRRLKSKKIPYLKKTRISYKHQQGNQTLNQYTQEEEKS